MTFGLGGILPISQPPQNNQPPEPAQEESDASNASGSSSTNGASNTEQTSTTPTSQSSEAKPTQTVQATSTDVAVAGPVKSDIGKSEPTPEQEVMAARKLAMKARSESIVAALIEAVSAPVEAQELEALKAADKESDAAENLLQADKSDRAKRSTEGLSALRGDA